MSYLTQLLSYCDKNEKYRIKLLCNWCSSEEISRCWDKMNNMGKIVLVKDNPDYYVIINGTSEKHDEKRSIIECVGKLDIAKKLLDKIASDLSYGKN